jgi:tellurium resistance protein TerD
MGLHWDAPEAGVSAPEDLDACCVLLGAQHRLLEVIHPGYPRNANASVIHTGDSRTGASTWDDERIFVFLEALPETVSTIVFAVTSATGRPVSAVRGGSCHVSDHVTERPWVRVDLTKCEAGSAHCVATLRRSRNGWEISTDPPALSQETLARLPEIAVGAKRNPPLRSPD